MEVVSSIDSSSVSKSSTSFLAGPTDFFPTLTILIKILFGPTDKPMTDNLSNEAFMQ